jgi:hypothetical protein
MVEMLLSVVPFGDVKHTGDTILRVSKQLLVHMKVTDNASNMKRAFKFFDDEPTNRKRK